MRIPQVFTLIRENVKLAKRLRFLLDEDTALYEIPSRILALDDVHSPGAG